MPTNGASGGYAVRGMAVLTKAKPDWPQRVDLAMFDMSRPGHSMLVQLFGAMDRVLLSLAPPRIRLPPTGSWISILPRSAPGWP